MSTHRRCHDRPGRGARGLGVLAVVLLLAACADDPAADGERRAAQDGVVRLVGQDDLRWDVERLTAPAGELTFELICEDAANHNVVIDELDEEVAACAPGARARGVIDLEPGTYTYVCTVPGHESTMRGELVVE